MSGFEPPGGADAAPPAAAGPPPPPLPPPSPWSAPPPQHPYGGYMPAPTVPPGPTRRSLKGLSVALSILLGVTAAGALFMAIATLHRASVWDDYFTQSFSTRKSANDSVAGATALFFLAFLATGIVWMVWQFRHAKNAEQLSGKLALGPGWAIGGWFIPVAQLALPQAQLFQSTRASDRETPGPSGFWPWVVFYDAAAVLFTIAVLVGGDSGDTNFATNFDALDQHIRSDRLAAVASVLYVIAAVAAIVLVRQVTDRQEAAMDRAFGQQGTATFGPPPTMGWPPPPTAYPPPAWSSPAPQYPPPPAPQYPPPPPPQYPPPPPPPPYPPQSGTPGS